MKKLLCILLGHQIQNVDTHAMIADCARCGVGLDVSYDMMYGETYITGIFDRYLNDKKRVDQLMNVIEDNNRMKNYEIVFGPIVTNGVADIMERKGFFATRDHPVITRAIDRCACGLAWEHTGKHARLPAKN